MYRSTAILASILNFSLLAASAVNAQDVTVTIQADKPGRSVNKNMYGIFLEEINHGVDGGLYGEMVANRAFEDSRPPEGFKKVGDKWISDAGWDSGFNVKPGTVPRWQLDQRGGKAEWWVVPVTGLNANSPYHLRVNVTQPAGTGKAAAVRNTGFWGVGFRKGASYKIVAHIRSTTGDIRNVRILGDDRYGNPVTSTLSGKSVGNGWTRIEGTITAKKTIDNAFLTLELPSKGTVDIDYVSCFPVNTWNNRPNGLRSDIAKMIADMKPAFVRFPGGCVVEGGSPEMTYRWKDGIGPVEERYERWNAWNYRRTHGMGALEYLQFCEDLKAQPMWVGFAGQTCIYRSPQHVPLSSMSWVIDDNIDFLQYAIGDPISEWGRKRAEAGHAAPFANPLVEIGNENVGPEYETRYKLVYAQVHKLFPTLTTIADYNIPNAEFDLIDEHYYNSPSWFFSQFNYYDNYDRKQKPVYVGEVAVTTPEGGPDKGNMLAALSEGVFLMGCENNADVVKMVSYAPLLAHVNGRSGWHGMIMFDSLRTAGTVSYHLWKLFHTNRPDITIPTAIKGAGTAAKSIAGKVGVGTWLTGSEYKDISVTSGGKTLYDSNANGFPSAKTEGGIWQTAGNVIRQVGKETGTYTFGDAGWSDYTLKLKARKISGDEGFLVIFGDKAGQRYWWNLGGWNNREHGIERNRGPVGQRVSGRIETGRWYDIEVSVSGGVITCKLDGKVIHTVPVPETSDVFASSGYDTAKNEVVVKLVNSTSETKAFGVSMSGLSRIGTKATMTVIRSDDPQANNTLLEPNKVVPAVSTIAWPPVNGKVTLGSNALAIIRFKARHSK